MCVYTCFVMFEETQTEATRKHRKIQRLQVLLKLFGWVPLFTTPCPKERIRRPQDCLFSIAEHSTITAALLNMLLIMQVFLFMLLLMLLSACIHT